MAPLGDVPTDQLAAVVARMKQRFDREVPPSRSAVLGTAVFILMGLRYASALIQRLLQGF